MSIRIFTKCVKWKDNAIKKKTKPQLPPKPGHLSSKTEKQPTKEEQCEQLKVELDHLEGQLKERQEELEAIHEDTNQVI